MPYVYEKLPQADRLLLSGDNLVGQTVEIRKQEMQWIVERLQYFKPVVEALYESIPVEFRDGHHDVRHIARTLVLSSLLIDMSKQRGISIDDTEVYWSVVLHDICSFNRSDEHEVSPDHGDLAADKIVSFLKESGLFSPDQQAHIINNVRWHNKKHSEIPDNVWTREFLILTNADALDLVRLPEERKIILTILDAWEIHNVPGDLILRCEKFNTHEDFDAVMAAALEI